MMSKNLPYWGESPQPGKTYYLMKLVCDIFGIIDHSTSKSYTYTCDEVAAGAKSTDHTISFFDHFVNTYVDSWVRKLTICLDNAQICKNRYLLAWASEVVKRGQFDSIRFFYMTVGHTKFKPDKLFASIAKTFYDRDVFCIEMLHDVAELYSVTHTFISSNIFQWRASLERKYSSISGITCLRDFIVTKERVQHRRTCYMGSFEAVVLMKDGVDDCACSPGSYQSCPATLTPEKLKQLAEQHDKFIKADVAGCVRPTFLPLPLQDAQVSRSKRHYPHCNGTGHVQAGKNDYLAKYCPVANVKRSNPVIMFYFLSFLC